MIKERNRSIDYLKFFAAILITNSHLSVYEPLYRFDTGGSIGDVLFFFCSGFTLFMGKMGRFDNWYKRRLYRIFPPVICWAVLAGFIFGVNRNLRDVIVNGGGWFVQCILIYYVAAWFIRKFAKNHLPIIFCACLAIVCLWFFLMDKGENFFLYGWNYCKWLVFFLAFVEGAYLGQRNWRTTSGRKTWLIGAAVVTSIVCWYLILYVQKQKNCPNELQLLSVVPLLFIPVLAYCFIDCPKIARIFAKKVVNRIVLFVGGLCYEIYLVQYTLFHFIDRPRIYPLSLVYIGFLIVLAAYVLHVFTNFCLQTFQRGDYDWKAMVKIY